MTSFLKRAVTGIFLLFVLILVAFLDRWALFVLLLFLSNVGLYELCHCLGIRKKYSLYFFNCLLQTAAFFNERSYYFISLLLFLLYHLILFTFTTKKENTLEELTLTIFTYFYISLLFSFLLLFHQERQFEILLVFVAAWGTDTFAYLSGMLFGRHPLIPRISPKKTWEGSIGGSIASVILAFFLQPYLVPELDRTYVLLIILFASIMGQCGDLFASRLKRLKGIKDYGSIFAGHGGVLDRFDSVLFAGPVVWILLFLRG